jgi:hypothetical protein
MMMMMMMMMTTTVTVAVAVAVVMMIIMITSHEGICSYINHIFAFMEPKSLFPSQEF